MVSRMSSKIIVINPKDNVAVALQNLQAGESVDLPNGVSLRLLSDVPYSHKIALVDIPKGASMIKYGEIIGEAKMAVRKGEWVHTHNMHIRDVNE